MFRLYFLVGISILFKNNFNLFFFVKKKKRRKKKECGEKNQFHKETIEEKKEGGGIWMNESLVSQTLWFFSVGFLFYIYIYIYYKEFGAVDD